MTLSTKPEVHNLLYCRQRRTEHRATATGNMDRENFVKCGHLFLKYESRQTDKQTNIITDTLIAILRTTTGGRSSESVMVPTVVSMALHRFVYSLRRYRRCDVACIQLARKLTNYEVRHTEDLFWWRLVKLGGCRRRDVLV